MPQLILASNSPRRRELLQKLNIPFKALSPNVDESISTYVSPEDIVMTLALRKANIVKDLEENAVVVGCDTVVVCDDQILGKPKNESEARDMLKQLSGRTHSVYTGVAIIHDAKQELFFEKTDVEFWLLSDEEIEQYIESGEYFDKAGAYGIQGLGALLVKSIRGDYYSVVGLPIARLSRVLREKFNL
ncbi:MAG TPA: Maf family protein [Bacillaceae bacterium]|nr:Maf family protein [Bacillaceae bacterium]